MAARNIHPRSFVAFLALLAGVAGCAEEPLGSPADPEQATPESSVVVADFIARVDPRARTVSISRVDPEPAQIGAPGRSPQSIDEISIVEDGVAGTGTVNTVELITNSVGVNGECPDGYQASTFCANVTLRHFYNRPINNAFVQVVSVRAQDGTLLPDHGAVNGDYSELGLDSTYGLWKYTADAAVAPGVLAQSPHNSGSRDWVFANPDDACTYIKFRVVASLTYANYMMDYSSQPFIDACAGGTSLGKVSSATQTMPFPFTLFNANSTTVRFNKRGMITFGTVNGTSTGNNLNLPAGLAPKPALFTFWDDIGYGAAATSAMCYQVLGSAPNRQYVITWKEMNFVPVADQNASLTFSAFLSEGTDFIDLVYGNMTGPTSRASGSSATVGVQNATATVSAHEYNTADFGTGEAFTLVPIP